jgi:hypothetical protein
LMEQELYMDEEQDLARYSNYLLIFSRKNVLLWRYPTYSQETYTSRQAPWPSKHWHVGYQHRLSLLSPPLPPWQIGPLWRRKIPVTNNVHPIIIPILQIGFPPLVNSQISFDAIQLIVDISVPSEL